MKDNGLVKGAGFLTLTLLASKLIGAFYRIPLTNIIGTEGMGLYQLVYPVFTLFLVLTSGAVPTAVSIIVGQKFAQGDEKEAKRVFTSTLLGVLLIGFIGTVMMSVLSEVFAGLQTNPKVKYGYLALAPSILLVGVLSLYRGWFLGRHNVTLNGLSQIFESCIKLGVGLALAKLLMRYGVEYAVVGALFGVTAGEIVALLYVIIASIIKKEKLLIKIRVSELSITIKEVVALCLPLLLGGMILPLSQFLDSFLVVNLIPDNLSTGLSATSEYGIFTGPVGSLINMPVSLCLALGAMAAPMISGDKAERRLDAIKEKSDTCIKLSFIVGLPFVITFLFIGQEILSFLYPSLSKYEISLASILLKIEAVNVCSLSVFQVFSSLLQGLGKTFIPVKTLSVCVLIKLILNIILLPLMGIRGAAIASLVCFSLAAIGNGVYYVYLVGKSKSLLKNSSLILLSSVIMSIIYFGISSLFSERWIIYLFALVGFLSYVFCLFVLRVFSKSELSGLPLSKLWLRLDGFFRRSKE